MISMRCHQVEKYLPDYCADALDIFRRIAIKRHLKRCFLCSCELEILKRTALLVEAVPPKMPPEDLWLKTKLATLNEQEAQIEVERGGHPSWLYWLQKLRAPIAISVSVVALVALLTLFSIKTNFLPQQKMQVPYNYNTDNDNIDLGIYFQRHALKAWNDPFADRASLGWAILASDQNQKKIEAEKGEK